MSRGIRLRLKPEGLRKLIEDLSESWGLTTWERGEELFIRPPLDDDLRAKGFLIVTLSKHQRERLAARMLMADFEARYEAKALP